MSFPLLNAQQNSPYNTVFIRIPHRDQNDSHGSAGNILFYLDCTLVGMNRD